METFSAAFESEENRPALRDLIRQLRSPVGMIPFVGAGMSVPLGFPGWTGLLLQSAKNIGIEEQVKLHIEAGQYEEAAQVLEDRLGERGFHDLIRESFGEHRLSDGGLNAPVALLPSIATGPVITTNFDRVLERVFEQAGRPFERVVKGAEIDTFGEALDLNLHVLLKVHGDAEDRTHRTLTKREYDLNYGANREKRGYLLARQLEVLAIRGRFLFLGCSLEQDRLMEVLARINETYQNVLHYALLQKPKDPDILSQRVKFLSDRGIRPIWYPEGQFENIPAFLHFLAEQLSIPSSSKIGEELADREQALLKSASSLFVGRETALRHLHQYASSSDNFIQVITGNPGMGKTALLAKWVTEKLDGGDRIAYHFFSERKGLTLIRDAYMHLLYQLSDTNPPIQEALAGAGEENLRQELYSRLKNLAGQDDAHLTLVLDGLDEAEQPFWPPFPTPLPAGLRVVASARSDKTQYLEGWADGRSPLTLEPLTVEDVGDWLRLVGDGILAEYADDQVFLPTLWEQTLGFPLYLHYLFEELVSARKAGQEPGAILALRQTPAGFSAYVRDQLNRLTREESGLRGNIRKVFALLSVALGAIFEEDLEALTGLTSLDLPVLPSKVTRWFDIRSHDDGTITCAFGHPELAAEFARALGKLARDMENDLISYCQKWAQHGSRYALEYLPALLLRAERYPELFELAREDSFCSFQRRVFPDDPQASLKTVRAALSAAANLNDAAAMAEFALLQARRILELKTETPIAALGTSPLSRVWQLADLFEQGRAILWHMLLAAELHEKGDNESAIRTLLRLRDKQLAPLSEWYGVTAAGLLLPLASLSQDSLRQLSQKLLPGYGQTIEVTGAIHQLAQRLVERGYYDLAIDIDKPAQNTVRVAIVNHRAHQGDLDGAKEEIERISKPYPRAKARAELAFQVSQAGDSQWALALLNSAMEDAQRAGRGQVDVAIQQARLGYLDDALKLAEEEQEALLYLARRLGQMAVYVQERGDDPGPVFEKFEHIVQKKTNNRWKRLMQAELAISYLKTGREHAAQEIRDTLLAGAERRSAASVRGLIKLAAGYAGATKTAEAERLFGLALKYAQDLGPDSEETISDIARAQADAGLFAGAAQTLEQMSQSTSRYLARRHTAMKRAAAGQLAQALNMLDAARSDHRVALAIIASDLLDTGKWQDARQVFIDLLQSTTEPAPWEREERDECLARIAVALVGQNQPDEIRATLQSIVDEEAREKALGDLAVAYAKTGEFTTALDLAQKISDGHAYDKERALGRVALERARQGEAITATSALEKVEGIRFPWPAAINLLILLNQQNALGLIEEFRLFQDLFQFAWWEKSVHIKAMRAVALAMSGDLQAALAEAEGVSGRRILATFEKITPIAIQQSSLNKIITTADRLYPPENAARALVGIGIAQIRLNALAEGERLLELAYYRIPEMKETHHRQEALVDIGIAYQIADRPISVADMWGQAFRLESWHYASDRESIVAPLHADDIYKNIAQGLAAAGLYDQAVVFVIPKINNLYERGNILGRIAGGFAPGGEFSREVLRVAQEVVLKRDTWVPHMIDVLVKIRDVDSVKLLLAPAAETIDAGFSVCGALAELYPEQAAAIAKIVRRPHQAATTGDH